MEFSIKQSSAEKLKCGCVVVGVYDSGKLSKAAQALDKAASQQISQVIKSGDMTGKVATTQLLHKLSGIE
ncbi:MAG: leucyl aminopeptidase, partial [Gallionella sp.]|nr:leucyl aminopeptidase [Gallionella sp.]